MNAALITIDVDSITPMIDEVPQALAGNHFDEIEQRLFGIRVGVPRILAALRRYGIAATFFVPGLVAERSPKTVAAIVSEGHEVALHGWRHTSPRQLNKTELQDDLDRSREALHRAGATEVNGYRAPEWHVTAELISILNSSDLDYDSSLGGYETPYRIKGRQIPLIELPVSWTLDDAPYLLCTSRSYSRPMNGVKLGEQWCHDIDSIACHGGLAVLTVHPWIIGRAPGFAAFEMVLNHVASTPGLWAGTATELVHRIESAETPTADHSVAYSWWEE